jgi:pSer/pThr/pTyr-binding forkhead associated (FHA) protein
MTTYFIGRNPEGDRNRIVVSDLTVSASHCTLSPGEGGVWEIIDNKSTNGTFVREKGTWREISKAKLRAEDEVRLGAYITTVAELIRLVQSVTAPAAPSSISKSRLERDPETGEIVTKTEF